MGLGKVLSTERSWDPVLKFLQLGLGFLFCVRVLVFLYNFIFIIQNIRMLFKSCTRLQPNQQLEAFFPFRIKHFNFLFNKLQGFFPYYRILVFFFQKCLVFLSSFHLTLLRLAFQMTLAAAVYLFPACSSDWRVFSSHFSGYIVLIVLLEGEGSTTSISFIQFAPTFLFCKLK